MIALLVVCGALVGLGVFVIVRPGLLAQQVLRSRGQLEYGMIWLVRRAQTQHRADLAIVGYLATDMVARKLTTMLIASIAAFGLIILLNLISAPVSLIL